ncbi:MAG: hypothetical protein J6S85_12455 [Methanobrevibacter sp.]|nr:hypothetical protein [Methanobrevibacter sp.]
MTDNNKIQANSFDDNKIQANLTELWKKGELPSRDDDHLWLAYYIKHKDGYIHADSLWRGQWGTADRNSIEEILAPVPTYQEYLALESDSLAKNEGEEIIAELEAENEKLKTEYEKECHRADELEDSYWKSEKENQKLKELLKECVPYVNHRFMGTRETLTKPYTASDKVLHKKAEKLLTKIDEVLK